jgi:hypothetical protein
MLNSLEGKIQAEVAKRLLISKRVVDVLEGSLGSQGSALASVFPEAFKKRLNELVSFFEPLLSAVKAKSIELSSPRGCLNWTPIFGQGV